MVTIILAFALLLAILSLGIEIGIASWIIHRASRYQSKESAARLDLERAESVRRDAERRLALLDDFATKISWLLNFLYKRYDRFSDLEKEVEEGLLKVWPEDPSDELNIKFEDLRKALKIIKVTVRASERVENLMESIASQVGQIMEDLCESDEPSSPAVDKKEDAPESAPAEPETSESAPAEPAE